MFTSLINASHRADKIAAMPVTEKSHEYLDAQTGRVGNGIWGDIQHFHHSYREFVWVYRSVFFIADAIARLPLVIHQVGANDELVDVSSHTDFEVLYKPNQLQTKSDFLFELVARLLLQGESFIELCYDENGFVNQLFTDWRGENVELMLDARFGLVGYRRFVNGNTIEVDRGDAIMMKLFNPINPLRGQSPIEAGCDVLGMEYHAVQHNLNMLKKGMSFSGVLETEQRVNKVEARRIAMQFRQDYGGSGNSGETAVLMNGLKYNPINTMSMRDAEYSTLRDMSRIDVVSGIYGLLPEVMGFGKATHENMDFAWKIVWSQTLLPHIGRIEDMLNCYLLPSLSTRDVIATLDVSGVEALQENKKELAERGHESVKEGVLTENEARRIIWGLDPVADPEMDKTRIQRQSEASQAAAAGVVADPGKQLIKALGQGDTGVGRRVLRRHIITKNDGQTRAARNVIWSHVMTEIAPHEQDFFDAAVEVFDAQQKHVIEQFTSTYQASDKSYGDIDRQKVGEELLDDEQWRELLISTFTPLFVQVLEDSGLTWADGYNVNHPNAKEWLGHRLLVFSQDINLTTRKAIVEQLQLGFDAFESIEQIANRIKSVFADATSRRATLIARTEAVGAWNAGVLTGLQQGNWQYKRWITSRDSRVRGSHRIDGQVVPVDQLFTLADSTTKMAYPMDFNERCTMIGSRVPE